MTTATDCDYCIPGELRAFRVKVCEKTITVKATHGRQARAKACTYYVRTHDWFASDDPWATVKRHSEVLPEPKPIATCHCSI